MLTMRFGVDGDKHATAVVPAHSGTVLYEYDDERESDTDKAEQTTFYCPEHASNWVRW